MGWSFFLMICIGIPLVKTQDYRLLETVVPSKYIVDIQVPEGVFNGTDQTFRGTVSITFRITAATSQIKLHHRNATIDNITLAVAATGSEVTFNATNYDSTTQILSITTQYSLSVRSVYLLTINYNGFLEKDAMNGLYISTYKNAVTGSTDYMVLTKFEPVHARHAFPCFDEPQLKATFQLILTHPTGLNAVSNTPISNSTIIGGIYNKTYFEETTVTSSYLVAWVISPFTCTEGIPIESGIPHRVCSRPQEEAHRSWALDFGTSVLNTLENITGIKYGTYMKKMDQFAIPDFISGAMENWGIVSYREALLLWSEEDSSNLYKHRIALTVAHEFSHNWFGNLVTCKWWDYLFLNEGFARFWQYFAAAATKQTIDWEMEKHFIVEVTQVALLADSTSDAASLTSAALSPSEAIDKFSTITYSKGAAILRMIEKNIMGATNFNSGIREYLATNLQKAATPANLWTALSNHVPANILPPNTTFSNLINNWVELNGHPVVTVNKSGDDITLSQQQFVLSGTGSNSYYVPITYTVSSNVTDQWNTDVMTWLVPGEALTITNVLNGGGWIVLNNLQAGFYRVDYDGELWSAIKSQLQTNHTKIDVLNRAQIISDLYNFARSQANTHSYADILDLMTYLEQEEEYYPWYAAIVGNTHLLQRIGYDTTIGKQFTTWMLKLMHKVYATVPFDTSNNTNQIYAMKQNLILSNACKYGEASCINKSIELFTKYRDGGEKVPQNLRTTVYCTALRYSADINTDFNFLWQKYTNESLFTEVLTILSSLGCADNTTSLKWLLSQTLNETSGLRLQDFTSIWSYVYSSGKTGTTAALEFITENYETLSAKYNDVSGLIYSIGSYIYENDQLEKLNSLINLNGLSDTDKESAQDVLASAQSNIKWASTVSANINSFLNGSSLVNSSTGVNVSYLSLWVVMVIVMLQKFLV